MRVTMSNAEMIDFCIECAPSMSEALEFYGKVGPGPDDRGNCFDFNSEHPPYDDWNYFCKDCGNRLYDYVDDIDFQDDPNRWYDA